MGLGISEVGLYLILFIPMAAVTSISFQCPNMEGSAIILLPFILLNREWLTFLMNLAPKRALRRF